jgi:hypothetical protein
MEIYLDQEYQYKGKKYKIRNIKKNFDKTVILTDKQHFVFTENEFIEFKNKIKPLFSFPDKNEKNIIKTIKMEEKKELSVTGQDDIKQILFDAIQEVKKNKDYVQQANAICNITSQLINIKKLENKL